jgi:hypothetical protein
MKYKKKDKAKTRQERNKIKKDNIEQIQKGEGLFLFKNRSNFATLELPKKSQDGKKWVGPNETWQGDSYFLRMIPKEAILIETLENPKKEEIMSEEKLILDQPDTVTTDGKVEHVLENQDQKLNEQSTTKKRKTKSESKKSKETLLTEDPTSGVIIID